MSNRFNRPPSISYPATYYKFKAPNSDNSSNVEYRIEDFPPERIEDGVKFMMEHFANDEPIFRARNVTSDTMAIEEGQQMWREGLEQNASIACFKKDSNEIIAMNILTIESEDEDDAMESDSGKLQSKNLRDILELHSFLQQKFSTFKRYKVKAYLFAFSMAVHSSYRGRGIATEMLKVRPMLLKALGLQVTTSHFVGVAGQNTATKAGYEENFVISYDELYKANKDFKFPGIDSGVIKVMSLRINEI